MEKYSIDNQDDTSVVIPKSDIIRLEYAAYILNNIETLCVRRNGYLEELLNKIIPSLQNLLMLVRAENEDMTNRAFLGITKGQKDENISSDASSGVQTVQDSMS